MSQFLVDYQTDNGKAQRIIRAFSRGQAASLTLATIPGCVGVVRIVDLSNRHADYKPIHRRPA